MSWSRERRSWTLEDKIKKTINVINAHTVIYIYILFFLVLIPRPTQSDFSNKCPQTVQLYSKNNFGPITFFIIIIIIYNYC